MKSASFSQFNSQQANSLDAYIHLALASRAQAESGVSAAQAESAAHSAQSAGGCNYSDNYYGDQICL